MINYLKDVSKSTPIGMLPDVINFNNDSIESEFNNIYNSSLNRLTKSVYAPTGSIKAHFGEFVNLSAEYITVKNVDSLKNTIQNCVDEIIIENASEHSALKGRFTNSDIEDEATEYSSQTQQAITHDAATIYVQRSAAGGYSAETLSDTISDIDTTIQDLSTRVLDNNTDINNRADNLNSSIIDLSNNIDNTYAFIEDISVKLADDINALKEHIDEAHVEVEDISARATNVSNYLVTIDSSISNISTYTLQLADEIAALDVSSVKSYYQAGQNISVVKDELGLQANINALGYTYDDNNNFIFDNGLSNNANKVSNTAIGAVVSGYNSEVIGKYSHAEGQSIAGGDGAHAEGNLTKANANYSHSEGFQTTTSGVWSHAEGSNTDAKASASHAEGNSTQALSSAAHAEGNGTIASGNQSHAEGNGSETYGGCSHAEGYQTKTYGKESHAEGIYTTTNGEYSHVEGRLSVADGFASHAEGRSTHALSNYSHAEGYNTISASDYSHAEGNSTTASGQAAHAEGYSTTASGNQSHAEGKETKANGNWSHSEGFQTQSNGLYSHAEGNNTIADGSCQLAIGEYNIADDSIYSVIVGNGTPEGRSNAVTISRNGVLWVQNDIKYGGSSQENATYSLSDLVETIDNKADSSLLYVSNIDENDYGYVKYINVGDNTNSSINISYYNKYRNSSGITSVHTTYNNINLGTQISLNATQTTIQQMRRSTKTSNILINSDNVTITVNGLSHTLTLNDDNIDKLNYLIENYDKINYILDNNNNYNKLIALLNATEFRTTSIATNVPYFNNTKIGDGDKIQIMSSSNNI